MSRPSLYIRLLLLWAIAGASVSLWAAPLPPGAMWLDGGQASGDTRDLFASLSQEIHWKGSRHRLTAGIGRTRANRADDPDPSTYLAQIALDIGRLLHPELRYLYYGQPGELTTQSFGSALVWNGRRGTLSIEPQWRQIRASGELPAIATPTQLTRYQTNSYGVSGSTTLLFGRRWDATFSGAIYRYRDDPRVRASLLLSSQTLSLSSGLLDWRTSADVGTMLGPVRMAAGYAFSRYIVDGSSTRVMSLSGLWYVRSHWAVGVEGGLVEDSLGTTTEYSRLIFGRFW